MPLAKIYKPSIFNEGAMIDTSYNQKKAPPTVAQAMLSGIMKNPNSKFNSCSCNI